MRCLWTALPPPELRHVPAPASQHSSSASQPETRPRRRHFSWLPSRGVTTRSDDAATERSFPSSASCERPSEALRERCGGGHGGPIWRSREERVMFWEPQGNGRGKQNELTEQNRSGRSATGRPANSQEIGSGRVVRGSQPKLRTGGLARNSHAEPVKPGFDAEK